MDAVTFFDEEEMLMFLEEGGASLAVPVEVERGMLFERLR